LKAWSLFPSDWLLLLHSLKTCDKNFNILNINSIWLIDFLVVFLNNYCIYSYASSISQCCKARRIILAAFYNEKILFKNFLNSKPTVTLIQKEYVPMSIINRWIKISEDLTASEMQPYRPVLPAIRNGI